jgi:hypothetical protein
VSRWFLVSRWFAVLVYLAGAIAFVLIDNADHEDLHEAMALLAAASLACGWLAGLWSAALLSLVLFPLALPFGYPESSFAEPFTVSATAMFVTLPSAALILVGVWIHRAWSRRRGRHTPAAQH